MQGIQHLHRGGIRRYSFEWLRFAKQRAGCQAQKTAAALAAEEVANN